MLIAFAFLGVLIVFVGLALTAAGICAFSGSDSGMQERGKRRLIRANYHS
jgi:hypothetical protein